MAPYQHAVSERAQTRANLGISGDALLVGGVGRLEPVKGFAYFVRAAHSIARALPNAHFVLAGDGAVRGELEAEAESLAGRFQFLGLRNDVPELMAAMDVCVVPSVNEGMGRVILEAGAAQTPVVASRVGGIPEVVLDGKTGLLVAPGDPDAIANAVLQLAGKPEQRTEMGRAAATFTREYSLENMVTRIEALYDTLIREKHLDA